MERSLSFALDYDGTYTADPELWDVLVATMQLRGHSVYIVTMRYESEPVERYPKGVLIYYTGREGKQPWCQRHGVDIDIWIDDNPVWLLQDSA